MPKEPRQKRHFTETYKPPVAARHLLPQRPNVIRPWNNPLEPADFHIVEFIIPKEEFGRIFEAIPFCEVIRTKVVIKARACLKKDLVKYTINIPYRPLEHQLTILEGRINANPLGFAFKYIHSGTIKERRTRTT
jgi:hypothetical protein